MIQCYEVVRTLSTDIARPQKQRLNKNRKEWTGLEATAANQSPPGQTLLTPRERKRRGNGDSEAMSRLTSPLPTLPFLFIK